MRNHKKLTATFLTFCLILLTAVPSFAATPGQALDGGEVKYGTVSARNANILRNMFDAAYYAEQHPDVAKVYGNNPEALFHHFIRYGVFEGRGCSSDFNVSAYRSSYGDLDAAFGDDIVSYYVHYAKSGKSENRELVTVEKAEAAGVVIKSATGATATVLTPKQEAEKAAEGTESSSESNLVVVDEPGVIVNRYLYGPRIDGSPISFNANDNLMCVKPGTTIEWSSDNTSTATVDEEGIIDVLDYGIAIITARLSTGETLSFEIYYLTDEQMGVHDRCLHDVDIIEELGRFSVTVTDSATEEDIIDAIRARLSELTVDTPLQSTWVDFILYNVRVGTPGTYDTALLKMVVDTTFGFQNYVDAIVIIERSE